MFVVEWVVTPWEVAHKHVGPFMDEQSARMWASDAMDGFEYVIHPMADPFSARPD